jgi:hypothetical protein
MEAVMSKTQSLTTKLSDTQLVIMSAGAKRADRSLIPFPQSLTVKGAALDRVIETLCKRNLVEERGIVDGVAEWRRDEGGRALGLFVTTNGLLALGLENADKDVPSRAPATIPRQRKAAVALLRRKAQKSSSAAPQRGGTRQQTKQDLVIQMLRRQSGVTIGDVVARTGWQPHSVRGFFSGLVKKKLKLPLVSEVGKDSVRRYRIAAVAFPKA